MEEEGGGFGLSKNSSDKGGEVDYKTKAGTAWSHSFLNQKPWHPLSYPNQRRKWIAEQTHSQKQRRAEEVAREYAQEQEFLRQTALISKKEKEKLEMMKAVSFMYVKPPGYNAESAKAAEMADEKKKQEDEKFCRSRP
ncbi:UNVERIFIED_CONTAM: putative zinc finger CCHC domain-containing protein [Sesamum radiatum]|uniref:Zinc finger CCHC domain-containing protein n=1 Tax=Sesamum radiatum TaxID=300843 RepID=A0AAW2TU10_SESRA